MKSKPELTDRDHQKMDVNMPLGLGVLLFVAMFMHVLGILAMSALDDLQKGADIHMGAPALMTFMFTGDGYAFYIVGGELIVGLLLVGIGITRNIRSNSQR